MNKRILIVICVLVFAILACGIPSTGETVSAPVQEITFGYDEEVCPGDVPKGYTDAKCYTIDDYSFGSVFYKGSQIKALGIITDIEYGESSIDKIVEFVEDVTNEASWDKDDVLAVTKELTEADLGTTVSNGDINGTMELSDDENYIFLMYTHR